MIDISPYTRWAHSLGIIRGHRYCRLTLDSEIKIPLEKILSYIDRIVLVDKIHIDDGSIKELLYMVEDITWETGGTDRIGATPVIYYKEGMKEKAETIFKLYS